MIETELAALLATVPSVGSRVYARRIPERATPPAISYRRVSTVPRHSHSGYSHAGMVRFQVSVFGNTFATARSTRDEVLAALNSYSGSDIRSLTWENDVDLQGADGLYGIAMDFLAFCNE